MPTLPSRAEGGSVLAPTPTGGGGTGGTEQPGAGTVGMPPGSQMGTEAGARCWALSF